MAWTFWFELAGHKMGFVYGPLPWCDAKGILVPLDADLDDPEYIKALKIGLSQWQFMLDELESAEYSKPKSIPISKKIDHSGYVYLIKSERGMYKIGRSKGPKGRIKTLEVKLPFEIEPICLIPTQNANRLEKQLHYRFESKRIDGEWFALTEEDVQYIKSLAEKAS